MAGCSTSPSSGSARLGTAAPCLVFAGHTDVVPPGDPASWTHPPFSGAVIDGTIWGRGATDMKSGVAAFVAAAVEFVTRTPPDGAVVLASTGAVMTGIAVLTLFVGALRDAATASILFACFGVALVCTVVAVCAFLVEILMAGRGIRDEVDRQQEHAGERGAS